MTLYYDVIQLTSKFEILIMKRDPGCRLRISTYNFDLDSDASKVIELFESVNLPHKLSEFNDKSNSRIAVRQLLICLSVWILWQFTAGFVPINYILEDLDPKIDSIDYIVNYLEKRESGKKRGL